MPNEGDSVHVSVVGTSDLVSVPDPSQTGTNYSWDYSSLSPNVQQYEIFQAPADFIVPYNYFFNQLNTSYGRNNYEFSSIPIPGVSIDAAYDFFKESSSQFKQIGIGYLFNNSIPVAFPYEQDDVVYEFPLTYNSTSTSTYKYGEPIPGIGYYGQTGTRTNAVDGWGTLITPFGTFQTLRVKSTIEATDTIYNTSLNAGANVPRATKIEYKWLANGKKIPVLKVETTVVSGNEVVSNVRYIDSLRHDVPQVGIKEQKELSLNTFVFPNPSVNEFVVSYELPAAAEVKIALVNMVGKEVLAEAVELQAAGAHKKMIGTAGLPAGVYFMNIQTGAYKETHKVIIAK